MSKRRFNSKKIAQQPLLKKRMAKYCARIEINLRKGEQPLDFEEILTNGHREYISYSDDSLAKEFDKKFKLVTEDYCKLKEATVKNNVKSYLYAQDIRVTIVNQLYQEGLEIANEIFEKEFLS